MSTWIFEPGHTEAEFRARHMMVTWVRGLFKDIHGSLELDWGRSLEATFEGEIDATGIWTGEPTRDAHLRSSDFFDVEHHPEVRFVSDSAELDGERLTVHGQLHAAGKAIPMVLDATLRQLDGELEIEAVTEADHRELGMTWSPLGILRSPSKLLVRGRLIAQ